MKLLGLNVLVHVAVLAALMACNRPAWADEPPPSTNLLSCRGPIPSLSLRGNAQDGCVTFDVGSIDADEPDHLDKLDRTAFRHFYFIHGDAACLGTGSPMTSGRDCSVDDLPSGQCAYVAPNFDVYAVTGGSCSQHGVPLCDGPFCH